VKNNIVSDKKDLYGKCEKRKRRFERDSGK